MNMQQVSEMDVVQKWWKQILTVVSVVVLFVTMQQQQIHANEKIENQDQKNESQDQRISAIAKEQNKTNNALNITNERLKQLTEKLSESTKDDRANQMRIERLIMILERDRDRSIAD